MHVVSPHSMAGGTVGEKHDPGIGTRTLSVISWMRLRRFTVALSFLGRYIKRSTGSCATATYVRGTGNGQIWEEHMTSSFFFYSTPNKNKNSNGMRPGKAALFI